jgi:hypothetical protein
MYTFTAEEESIEEIRVFVDAKEMANAIDKAKNIIRTRLKHGDTSPSEEEILEQIREVLWYER